MTNFTDRHGASHPLPAPEAEAQVRADDRGHVFHSWSAQGLICLLYTSDAADDYSV